MVTGKTKSGVEIRRLRGISPKEERPQWVLVADRSKLRIYERSRGSDGTSRLTSLQEIRSPRGRAKGRDILSDRPGRSYQSPRGMERATRRHALSKEQSPADHEMEKLIQEGLNFLEKGWARRRFGSLRILAEPHFLGRIKGEIRRAGMASVTTSEKKNFARLSGAELLRRLEGSGSRRR